MPPVAPGLPARPGDLPRAWIIGPRLAGCGEVDAHRCDGFGGPRLGGDWVASVLPDGPTTKIKLVRRRVVGRDVEGWWLYPIL